MRKVTLLTSFFSTPIHTNRAPYNEQLFLRLKESLALNIVRPIVWTDLLRADKSGAGRTADFPAEWNGIPICYPTYFALPVIGHAVNGLLYFLSVWRSFVRTGSTESDLVYSSWAYPDAYAAMLLAKRYRKPLILRVHGSDVNVLLNRQDMRHKILEVFQYAHAIVSPSAELKRLICEAGIPASKVHVVYSGVDKTRFYPKEKQQCEQLLNLEVGKKRILYVGNFKQQKGVLDLVKAASILAQSHGDFELVLVGKGEDRPQLEALIGSSGITHQVNLVGEVNHEDLNNWMNASTCLCLPSYAEGMPNVVLEALCTSTRVVATDVGGIAEVLPAGNKNLMEPADVNRLAEALEMALYGELDPIRPLFEIESYAEVTQRILGLIDAACQNSACAEVNG